MNIATLNILEPRPIDTRRMIPVENLPLIQSTLNDRILLDLHPWLVIDRTDFRSSHNDSQSKKIRPKASNDDSPKREHISHFVNDTISPLVASSAVDETENGPKTQAPARKQALADESDELSAAGAPEASSDPLVFRSSQLEQWNTRYQELIQFKEEYNHCSVPLHYPNNPSLAHWVKRQRHQYRMKKEKKRSTLTDQRQDMLESLGFIWDSHATAWDERWDQLSKFRDEHGHSRVPKKYTPNQPLSIWVKCQRRQFKLFSQGKPSNMTIERIRMLKALDFVFDPRSRK
ncbi:unnamed protein product [Cylindrotheca closterium]|uniref:Helicase-associated domain-containing protein n=1 Tax=Cylindrotheca closterium TaxID=2856 RepID=A0AAD2CIS4_9STRA|nr:unnamed protein product [Cylindrotheca closterium]